MWMLLAAAGLALALVIMLLLAGKKPGGTGGDAAAPGASERTCPLCGSRLAPGERVRSDIAPGKGDRIMRIFGCPHCEPGRRVPPGTEPRGGQGTRRGESPPGYARICPYCRGEVPVDGWVIARYFERPGRRHIHVLGCTRCRNGG